ncbi:hypothetical protein EDD15DRAFT_2122065, partial [Pisolithus albus]
ALSDVANDRTICYSRCVEFADLQTAINHYLEAPALLPPSYKGELVLFRKLGDALLLRHTRLGDLKDLDEAIEKHRLALSL